MNKTLARVCFGGWILFAVLDIWRMMNVTMNIWILLKFAIDLYFIWYFTDKI